jgi:hypothetical protein
LFQNLTLRRFTFVLNKKHTLINYIMNTLEKPIGLMTAGEFLEILKSQQPAPAPVPKKEIIKGLQALALRFKVSTPTVFKWKKEGLIPYSQIGRSVYFEISAVEEALRAIGKC